MNKNNMNFAIRKFIANIPLAKSLYHVVRQRREKLRARHAQAELEKKQPVIRQGSLRIAITDVRIASVREKNTKKFFAPSNRPRRPSNT